MDQKVIEGNWEEVVQRADASDAGLIRCLKGGPADLSTNPVYMQGFGGE